MHALGPFQCRSFIKLKQLRLCLVKFVRERNPYRFLQMKAQLHHDYGLLVDNNTVVDERKRTASPT